MHRPYTAAHLTSKTVSGAIVSIVGVTLMAVLFAFELLTYLRPQRVTTMVRLATAVHHASFVQSKRVQFDLMSVIVGM